MEAYFHGGYCCGITHIYGFIHPASVFGPITRPPFTGAYSIYTAKESAISDIDVLSKEEVRRRGIAIGIQYGAESRQYPFITADYPIPQETALERFKRILRNIDVNRKKGIVEAVLIQSQREWHPILLEHGFVEVSRSRNSNSGNRLYVYHRFPPDQNVPDIDVIQ